ncbi:MAG: hypothetical protein VYA30_02825 [Myxococcota bacterium]|nr:hypothetical protein [Myxococcota bacterium]
MNKIIGENQSWRIIMVFLLNELRMESKDCNAYARNPLSSNTELNSLGARLGGLVLMERCDGDDPLEITLRIGLDSDRLSTRDEQAL